MLRVDGRPSKSLSCTRVETGVAIRDIRTFAEYEGCVDLQREVWRFPEVDIIPAAHLVVIHLYGGTCLGAFDGERLVGFSFGFVGWEGGKTSHHSHMLAVVPSYRDRGVGEALKWVQRERVLAQGMDLVNWTFDPLQAPNANFNVNRLGAVARRYFVNIYGESTSPLHGGLPTDRLEAEWWIRSSRVQAAREKRRTPLAGSENLPRANRGTEMGPFLRCEDDLALDLDAEAVRIEIPARITPMMAEDRARALDWRLKTRALFQAYFERGYGVVDFLRVEGRCYYVLSRALEGLC